MQAWHALDLYIFEIFFLLFDCMCTWINWFFVAFGFCFDLATGADVEQYLHYVGGAAGMLALTGVGVAAASAYYLASRPTPTLPPFDLDHQTIIEVSVLV